MTRPSTLHAAAIMAIAAALLLGGCGRKGKLDAPPDATPTPQAAAPQQQPDQPRDALAPSDVEDKPVATTGPKRRLPIDVLLN